MSINVYRPGVVFVLCLVAAGCQLDEQTAPDFIGPSGYALSIRMEATPDQLPRDGVSEATVKLKVLDASAVPVKNQRITLSFTHDSPAGSRFNFSDVTTNDAGEASFNIIAPSPGSRGDIVVIASPVGTNASNMVTRSLAVAALPRNGTLPTFSGSAFTVDPSTPEIGGAVTFTAGSVSDEGSSCLSCSFAWSFGDGDTATGSSVTHTFDQVGLFQVRLTVTDGAGSSATATQSVSVIAVTFPTASFAPVTAVQDVETTFTATADATGDHRITTFTWNWGDGTSEQSTSSPVIRHTFDSPGIYNVTLTVTDDLGQKTSVSNSVTVN